MRRVLPLKLILAALLAACVTVNVYFPAAAAQQAADQVINSVIHGSGTATPPQGSNNNSSAEGSGERSSQTSFNAAQSETTPALLLALGRTLELLVPAAHAQANANLNIDTPEIRAVRGSMQQRFPQLQKYLASGAVGLTNNGLVEVRDPNAVPLAERAVVTRLVSEENRDRSTLYAEIAKANGHPEWEPDIRKTFASRWVANAQPGWYYQDGSGAWKQK